MVYHGPREQVVPFFNRLGFQIPERKGVADFIQEICSEKDQEVCQQQCANWGQQQQKNTYLLGQHKFDERSKPKHQGGNERESRLLLLIKAWAYK